MADYVNYLLYQFWAPAADVGVLRHNNGTVINAVLGTHPTGRAGLVFVLPADLPEEGCTIELSAPGGWTQTLTGTLFTRQSPKAPIAVLDVDDGELVQVLPDEPERDPWRDPAAMAADVYGRGTYDLRSKADCGRYTEDVCLELHLFQSRGWGHVRKDPGQNHVEGPDGQLHAVDAIMLVGLGYWNVAAPAIYDLIRDAGGPDAAPVFNVTDAANPALWYSPTGAPVRATAPASEVG